MWVAFDRCREGQRAAAAADDAHCLNASLANLIGAKVDFAFFIGMTFFCGRGSILRIISRLLAARASGHQQCGQRKRQRRYGTGFHYHSPCVVGARAVSRSSCAWAMW